MTFMNSIENAIKSLLLSMPVKNVSRGLVPLDAEAGSVYFSVSKVSYEDGAYSATVKISYFPLGTPSSSDGETVFGYVGAIRLGGVEYDAEGYECRIFDRYVEVTVRYIFDVDEFDGNGAVGGDDSVNGDLSDGESTDGSIFESGILMNSISVTVSWEDEL